MRTADGATRLTPDPAGAEPTSRGTYAARRPCVISRTPSVSPSDTEPTRALQPDAQGLELLPAVHRLGGEPGGRHRRPERVRPRPRPTPRAERPAPRARARRGPDHPRDLPPAEHQLRDAVRPRGHLQPRQRPGRRHGLRRGGRRSGDPHRPGHPAGRDAPAGRAAAALRPHDGRGDAAAAHAQGPVRLLDRGQPDRERGGQALPPAALPALQRRVRRPGDPEAQGGRRPAGRGRRRVRARGQRGRDDRRQGVLSQSGPLLMDTAFLALLVIVAVALAFDYTNGFHDAANAIAVAVSTKALTPRVALGLAAVMNLVGALISTKVAATVGGGIIDPPTGSEGLKVVFAALIGAIAWNLITWYFGLPSSSSHALIGGLVGAALAAAESVQWMGILDKVVVPMVLSPLIGFGLGYLFMLAILWTFRSRNAHRTEHGFRRVQILSSA